MNTIAFQTPLPALDLGIAIFIWAPKVGEIQILNHSPYFGAAMEPMGIFSQLTLGLSTLGMVQALFLAAILWVFPNKKPLQNGILAVFLIVLSLVLMHPALERFVSPVFPKATCFIDPFVFLLGPLMYVYLL